MKWSAFLLCLFCLQSVQAEIVTRDVQYSADGVTMHGYVAWDDTIEGRRPGVLVVHEWWGQTDYPRKRAEMLAALGYTAMAVDMYGDGKEAEHPKDAETFMNEVMANLPGARQRFDAALDALKDLPTVDPDRIAAIGYCFGGYVVLHMALQGVDLDLVGSFHGSLPSQFVSESVETAPEAMLAIYTGADDPMIPVDDVRAFEQQLKALDARYQVKIYPGAKHAFTNPEATAKGEEFQMPLEYDQEADADSWADLQRLLKQELGRQPSGEGGTPEAIDPSIEEQAALSPTFPADIEPPGPLSPKERTLFQYAYTGDLEKVQQLAAKGVPVDSVDQQKRTPLMLAAYNGHTQVVEFLAGKGADINAQDKDSQSALTYTVKRSFYDTAEYLVNNGAEVNVSHRKNGVTPLMIAAVAGDLPMVRLLLDHGADPSRRSSLGQTAASLAQKKGNTEVVELLSGEAAANPEG